MTGRLLLTSEDSFDQGAHLELARDFERSLPQGGCSLAVAVTIAEEKRLCVVVRRPGVLGAMPVLGVDTFGDLIHDERGKPLSHADTIRSVVEQGVLADEVGVDFFGIGEHHTNDFPMPAADIALAAIAARTARIHLGSAVADHRRDLRPSPSSSGGRSPSSESPRGRVGVHGPGHVAAADEQAREEFWPQWLATIARVGKERGFRPPTEESFAYDVGPEGALYVGSPETVAEKIVANLRALDASRFDLKFGMPGLTHEQVMTTIELFGTEVIPRVRQRVEAQSVPTTVES